MFTENYIKILISFYVEIDLSTAQLQNVLTDVTRCLFNRPQILFSPILLPTKNDMSNKKSAGLDQMSFLVIRNICTLILKLLTNNE